MDIRTFAQQQSEALAEGKLASNMVSFSFEGMKIVNPWLDETGRFELTDEEAVKLYGKENIEKFIEAASHLL